MCAQPYMDQTKKIFNHFICIWSVFNHSLFLGFVPTFFFNVSSLFLCWKTRVRVFLELFATWLRVAKLKDAFLAILGHQAVGFTSSSQVGHSRNAQINYFMGILQVFGPKLLIWLYYDSIFSKPSFSKLLHQNPTNFNCFTFHKHL